MLIAFSSVLFHFVYSPDMDIESLHPTPLPYILCLIVRSLSFPQDPEHVNRSDLHLRLPTWLTRKLWTSVFLNERFSSLVDLYPIFVTIFTHVSLSLSSLFLLWSQLPTREWKKKTPLQRCNYDDGVFCVFFFFLFVSLLSGRHRLAGLLQRDPTHPRFCAAGATPNTLNTPPTSRSIVHLRIHFSESPTSMSKPFFTNRCLFFSPPLSPQLRHSRHRFATSRHYEQMASAQTVYRITAGRFASNRWREVRTGCQIGSARHSRRCSAQAVVGATGNGDQGQEVRHGAEHQDGADEADAGTPATGARKSTDAGAATAGVGIDVSVSRTTVNNFKAFVVLVIILYLM